MKKETNIFKNAKFGDLYHTKSGKKALFLHESDFSNTFRVFVLVSKNFGDVYAYTKEGKIIHTTRDAYNVDYWNGLDLRRKYEKRTLDCGTFGFGKI